MRPAEKKNFFEKSVARVRNLTHTLVNQNQSALVNEKYITIKR